MQTQWAKGFREAVRSYTDTKQAELAAEVAKASAENGEAAARLEAEAEAKAIDVIAKAVSGTKADPANFVLAQQYIDALKSLSKGSGSKTVFLPVEATNVLGSIGGIKELFEASK